MGAKETRALKALSELNLIPFVLMLAWCAFVIVIYANPNVWSGFLICESTPFYSRVFKPDEKYMLVSNALRMIALIFICFQLASVFVGFAAARKKRLLMVWQVLLFVNVLLCLISTNVISACITGYIFAKLGNFRDCSDNKC